MPIHVSERIYKGIQKIITSGLVPDKNDLATILDIAGMLRYWELRDWIELNPDLYKKGLEEGFVTSPSYHDQKVKQRSKK